MRLLICTQIVDSEHPVLGFFHRWIEEFAKHCDEVHVVCLQKGSYNFPRNVFIHSLGKEDGVNHLKYLWRFYTYCWKLRGKYDRVFVHMIPQYVLLGWILWRLQHKRIGLWYMHKSTNIYLRLAEQLVDAIFTASKESFRIPSKKLHITGHGIDTARFAKQNAPKTYDMLTVGRITASKNLEMLVDVLECLRNHGYDISLRVVGVPTSDTERTYGEAIKRYIKTKGMDNYVDFIGAVPNKDLPMLFGKTKVFVHAATNGSLDKALLEPLAAGVPVVTSAEGAVSLPLGNWHVANLDEFSNAVIGVLEEDTSNKMAMLKNYVTEHHSIQALIPKILEHLE